MSEQQQAVYVPPKKKNVGLWLTAGLVVISVVAFVFAESPEPKPVADASLEPGLLVAADFPTGFSKEGPVTTVYARRVDEVEFVRLANAANDRVRSAL